MSEWCGVFEISNYMEDVADNCGSKIILINHWHGCVFLMTHKNCVTVAYSCLPSSSLFRIGKVALGCLNE